MFSVDHMHIEGERGLPLLLFNYLIGFRPRQLYKRLVWTDDFCDPFEDILICSYDVWCTMLAAERSPGATTAEIARWVYNEQHVLMEAIWLIR